MAIISIAFLFAFSFAGDEGQRSAEWSGLRAELLRRKEHDQAVRRELMKWSKDSGRKLTDAEQAEFLDFNQRLRKLDAENTDWLRGVVDKHGWPTITAVGPEAANAAWLLVQHADAAPKFQRRCLNAMRKLPKEEVSQSKIAYLTDRVLLAEGKRQRFGTQWHLENGELKMRPLEDPDHVDQRRAEAGLPPLKDYVRQLRAAYQLPAKPDAQP